MDQDFYISERDWNKIQNYAQEAYNTEKSEIGGMLVAIEDDEGDWELKDPVILKQQISSGNCVLDKDDLALYYTKVGSKLKKKNFRFVWWHSHHTMKAFWSGTDLTAIKEYSDGDFSFALVVNLDEEYKLRVSVWKPFEVHEDVDLTIITKEKKVPQKIQDEVADKCSPIVSQYGTWQKGTYTKGKSNQMTLAGTEAIKTGGPKYNQELSGDSVDYIYAYNMIDEMNKRYCDGRLTYEGWITMAKDINKLLENTYDSIYRVELITEPVLEAEVMLATPHEYISIDLTSEAQVEAEMDDWLDYKSYNTSYGVK
tara:strand:+ start:947 stop:1882 length:936 start_codon:yes stop_codon:yes gene_type:complete